MITECYDGCVQSRQFNLMVVRDSKERIHSLESMSVLNKCKGNQREGAISSTIIFLLNGLVTKQIAFVTFRVRRHRSKELHAGTEGRLEQFEDLFELKPQIEGELKFTVMVQQVKISKNSKVHKVKG